MATLSCELKNEVVQYLQGQVTLHQLESWLMPRIQCFMEPPATADAEMAAAVYHGLVEIGDGLRTEDQMRGYLHGVLRRIEAQPCPADCKQEVTSSASNRVVEVEFRCTPVDEPIFRYVAEVRQRSGHTSLAAVSR